MIRRRLPKDMYNRCVTFLFGTTDEVNRYMTSMDKDWRVLVPQTDGRWAVLERDGYQSDFIIVVKKPRFGTARMIRNYLHAVIVHETFHCASYALRHAGIQHTEDTEEAYTYYQQLLFSQCTRFLS